MYVPGLHIGFGATGGGGGGGGGVIKILKSTRGMQYGSVNVQRLGGGTFLLKVRIILNCE